MAQKPISQLFVALKSHFWNVNLSHNRSLRTTEQNLCFRNILFVTSSLFHSNMGTCLLIRSYPTHMSFSLVPLWGYISPIRTNVHTLVDFVVVPLPVAQLPHASANVQRDQRREGHDHSVAENRRITAEHTVARLVGVIRVWSLEMSIKCKRVTSV